MCIGRVVGTMLGHWVECGEQGTVPSIEYSPLPGTADVKSHHLYSKLAQSLSFFSHISKGKRDLVTLHHPGHMQHSCTGP